MRRLMDESAKITVHNPGGSVSPYSTNASKWAANSSANCRRPTRGQPALDAGVKAHHVATEDLPGTWRPRMRSGGPVRVPVVAPMIAPVVSRLILVQPQHPAGYRVEMPLTTRPAIGRPGPDAADAGGGPACQRLSGEDGPVVLPPDHWAPGLARARHIGTGYPHPNRGPPASGRTIAARTGRKMGPPGHRRVPVPLHGDPPTGSQDVERDQVGRPRPPDGRLRGALRAPARRCNASNDNRPASTSQTTSYTPAAAHRHPPTIAA